MLSQEIKATRLRLKLTQGQLAEKFGVALNTISRWENGTSTPEGEGMIRLALRQLESEALFSNQELVTQMEKKIEALRQSKAELTALVKSNKKSKKS